MCENNNSQWRQWTFYCSSQPYEIRNYVTSVALHMTADLSEPVMRAVIALVHTRSTLLCKWPHCGDCAKRIREMFQPCALMKECFWQILLTDPFLWRLGSGPWCQQLTACLMWTFLSNHFIWTAGSVSFLKFEPKIGYFYTFIFLLRDFRSSCLSSWCFLQTM